jgi:hypothetical protein
MEGVMAESRSDAGSGFSNPEADLGGADSLPDTVASTRGGTEPNQQYRSRYGGPQGPQRRSSALNWGLVITAVAMVLILLYLVAMLRV